MIANQPAAPTGPPLITYRRYDLAYQIARVRRVPRQKILLRFAAPGGALGFQVLYKTFQWPWLRVLPLRYPPVRSRWKWLKYAPQNVLAAVPNVVGDTLAAATSTLNAIPLAVTGPNYATSSTIAVGLVSAQYPPAGTKVLYGSSVLLTLSLGPSSANLLVMPNVVGVNYEMALKILQASGVYVPVSVLDFNQTTITVKWTKSTKAPGLIVSQSPTAASIVPIGIAITLTVSAYPFGSMIDSPPDWRQ